MAPPKPSSQFENQPNEKYQVMRSNIPSQPKNYYKVIQSHGLHEQQCLVSGKLDDKIISILMDFNRQNYEWKMVLLTLFHTIQSIPFSVSGTGGKPLILLGNTYCYRWRQVFSTTYHTSLLLPVVLEPSYLNPLDNIFGNDKFNTLRFWLMLKTIVYRCIVFFQPQWGIARNSANN